MLFNSYIFVLFFLPLALFGYYFCNYYQHYRCAKFFLLGMSIWFYGYFNISYLLIILISMVGNYTLSVIIDHLSNKRLRKVILAIAIISNIASIFYYKYYDFFASTVNTLFQTDFVLLNLVLPLGISFFTFQQVGYQIDHFREHMNYGFWDYALFVSFFPQLVAGPIVTHKEIVPQFENKENKQISWDNIEKGISIFTLGLSKKVLIADVIGSVANFGYSNIEALDTTNSLLVMLAYTFQIYFDFSGYSDMAVGIAWMFNIKLPQNFNSPYKAYTIGEFWKRWHITLTRFLREYIYIPMGGNRKGKYRTYFNTMIVYLFSGLWHGANWTFILWGAIHGGACILDRVFHDQIERMHFALKWILTFVFVNITWVYFRADSIKQANKLLHNLINIEIGPILPDIIAVFKLPELTWLTNGIIYDGLLVMLIYIMLFLVILAPMNLYEKSENFNSSIKNGIVIGALLVLNILSFSKVSTFLYFNF